MQILHNIVRQRDLTKYCGLKRAQINRLIRSGKFPKPVQLSDRRKAWLEVELIAWQRQKISDRNASHF